MWFINTCRKSSAFAVVARARKTDLIQRLGQKLCTAAMSDIPVSSVIPEEFGLGVELIAHRFIPVDVLLTSIDDTDESELERVHSTGENVERVRSSVHEIQFRQYSDRATALWIDVSGQLERIRVGEIDVGGTNSENDTAAAESASSESRVDTEGSPVGLRDVVQYEVADLTLDVGRLISDGNLGETG